MQRRIDDPQWVLERYREAKELLNDIREFGLLPVSDGWPVADIRQAVEDFHNETYLDGCTTLGPDCACNGGA